MKQRKEEKILFFPRTEQPHQLWYFILPMLSPYFPEFWPVLNVLHYLVTIFRDDTLYVFDSVDNHLMDLMVCCWLLLPPCLSSFETRNQNWANLLTPSLAGTLWKLQKETGVSKVYYVRDRHCAGNYAHRNESVPPFGVEQTNFYKQFSKQLHGVGDGQKHQQERAQGHSYVLGRQCWALAMIHLV